MSRNFKLMRKPSVLEAMLIILLLVIGGMYAQQYYESHKDLAVKERDADRISDIHQIQNALAEYSAAHNNQFPNCLYKAAGCKALEGSSEMPVVPKDQVSDANYVYAAYGSGSSCTGYHLGATLERTASQALLTGSDASPLGADNLCTGSAPDFSGLSYAKAGQPCDLSVGIPQPTDAANGETCYDLTRRRPVN